MGKQFNNTGNPSLQRKVIQHRIPVWHTGSPDVPSVLSCDLLNNQFYKPGCSKGRKKHRKNNIWKYKLQSRKLDQVVLKAIM